jgi:hypothetical protein
MIIAIIFISAARHLLEREDHALIRVTKARQRHTEQDRDEQRLENIAARKRAHRRVGNDVQQEADDAVILLRGGKRRLDVLRVEGRDVDVHSDARSQHLRDQPAAQQRHGGHDLEIDQGLEPNPPHRSHAAHPRNADDDGREDDRRDHHPDHRMKASLSGLRSVPVKWKSRPRTLKFSGDCNGVK